MNKLKKVSVIIPTYKRAKYLDRAILSVLDQSYNNIEIIVVDDNDEDSEYRFENEKIMEKYENYNNVVYLKHKKNRNGSAARNTGIKAAKGFYITFLDDDDFFLKGRVEKLVRKLEKNPEYSAIYSSVAFQKNNKIIKILEATNSGNFHYELLNQKSFFGTGSNLFFTKQSIDKIGLFDERFIRNQDIEYMIRFFRKYRILNLKEILVIKNVDDTSNLPNLEKLLGVRKLFLETFKKDIDSYPDKNDIYYNNYLQLYFMSASNTIMRKKILEEMKKYKKIGLIKKIYLYIKIHFIDVRIFIKKINNNNKCKQINKNIKDEIEYYNNLNK